MDILKDRLPPERNDLFLSYGIDLKLAITCCPLDPVISLVKIEPGVLTKGAFFHSEDVFFDQVNIKMEEPNDDDNHFLDYGDEPITEFKEESFESDEEPLFKKWKNVVKKKKIFKSAVKKESVCKFACLRKVIV